MGVKAVSVILVNQSVFTVEEVLEWCIGEAGA
jgi:hypothetical protein